MNSDYLTHWRRLGLDVPATFLGDEHVRYGIFLEWISDRCLNEGQVEDVVSLIGLEPDVPLQMSFFVLVIKAANDEALRHLLDIEQQRPFVEEEIALRRLEHGTNEAEQLQIAEIPSKKVQKKLLDKRPYPSVALILQNEGVTRAVRNQANALVRLHERVEELGEARVDQPNKRMRHLFIVIRIDRYDGAISLEGITATKVFASESAAEAEVSRLTALNPQSQYVIRMGRKSRQG